MKAFKREQSGVKVHQVKVTPAAPAPFTREERVAASNEWMRRYIEEPERFLRDWQAVAIFQAEESARQEPSYGEQCEAYLEQLMTEARSVLTVPATFSFRVSK